MGLSSSRQNPRLLHWDKLVCQLLKLIKVRSLYLAVRKFIEYRNIDNLLLPLRRRTSVTPEQVRPLSPSAPPLATQALFHLEDFERSRSARRPTARSSFPEFLADRPYLSPCGLRD